MTTDAQLRRVERQLSPQQAAVHWYGPILEAETSGDFTVRLWDASQADDIGAQWARVRAPVTASMRGRPPDEIKAAERAAMAEYYFLHDLILQVNSHAGEQWEAWQLRATLTATQGAHLTRLEIHGLETPAGHRRGRAIEREEKEYAFCRALLPQSMGIFAGTLQAVERISQTYAAGAPILFRGAMEQLTFGVRCATLLEETCQEHEPDVDTDASGHVEAVCSALCRLWVDSARWDLFGIEGRDQEAAQLIERRVSRLR